MNTETLRQIFKSPFDYATYSREIVHRLFGCHDVAARPEWLDTNAEGTKLKSLVYEQGLIFNLGVGYKFSF